MWRGAILLLSFGLAQCPYVRYIHFNACGNGMEEGLNEYLLLWSGPGFNINNLAISFPVLPNSTNLDCGASPTWVCNSCAVGWTCPSGLVTNLNSTACSGTTFACITTGQNIPANSWLLLFTGNAPTYVPNTSAFCGAGTVYVAVANQSTGQGRYLNTPTVDQNRRTRIAFATMPACSMTVNYEQVSSDVNGDALLIDPSTCMGQTAGANESNTPGCSAPPYTPPAGACRYASSSSNGVTLHRPNNCDFPPLSVLPLIWSYVRVEGADLVWAATGVGQDARASVSLWHRPADGGLWREIAGGLPLQGRYPLSERGLYQLRSNSASGGVAESPVVEFVAAARPYLYPNPAPGGPYLAEPDAIQVLEVLGADGRLIHRMAAPLTREVLRGLPSGLYVVRLLTVQGEVVQRVLVP